MENINQTQGNTEIKVSSHSNVITGVSKACISLVAILGVLVGIWSLSCVVSGLIESGGPIKLLMGWFKAVSGM